MRINRKGFFALFLIICAAVYFIFGRTNTSISVPFYMTELRETHISIRINDRSVFDGIPSQTEISLQPSFKYLGDYSLAGGDIISVKIQSVEVVHRVALSGCEQFFLIDIRPPPSFYSKCEALTLY